MNNKLATTMLAGLLLTTALGLGASACKREERALGTTAKIENTVARDRIAEARCDLEMRCGNVGAGKQYMDRGACLAQIKQDWKDELNFKDCPAGLNNEELSECLGEIRNTQCGNPLDTLERVVECRSKSLCLH